MNSESSLNGSSLPSYRFASFKLDPSERRLEHNGTCIFLTPKAFETLLLLLQNSGRLLEKEQFMRSLWPDSVVEEANLAHYISQLRKVFQEKSPGEHFIETVPKLGYRFVAPVELIPPVEASAPGRLSEPRDTGVDDEDRGRQPASAGETPARRHLMPKLLWILPAVLIMAFLTATGWRLLKLTGKSNPVLTAVPFATEPGAEFDPSFSPDGSHVAFGGFLDEKEPNVDIYVKSVGSEKPLRLTSNPEVEAQPAWSPDGSLIAFFRFQNDRFIIYTIPPLGGVERNVYETKYLWKPGFTTRLFAWTPDSKGIVISESLSFHGPNALFLIKLETGEKVKLTSPLAGSVGDCDPVFSPDGRILTFCRVHAPWSVSDLYRLDLSSDFTPVAEAVPLTDRMPLKSRDFAGHAWTADGREIIASLHRGWHTRDFWRIPLDNPQRATRLPLAEERGTWPVISGAARRMAFIQEQPGIASIWSLEDSGESKQQPKPERLLSSTHCEGRSQVSPGGDRLAFESARTGFSEICVANSDGTGFLRLTDHRGGCRAPVWSPDSRWIAYDAHPEGQGEVYVISAEGGRPQRITRDPAEDILPTWSQDGRWIYFTSNRTGRWQVWKMPSGGGDAVQVTSGGGWYAKESIDGRTLFFAAGPEVGVYRMPVEGGEPELFLSDAMIEFFAPAAKGVYFWRVKGSYLWFLDGALVFLDSATGARRVVHVTDQLPSSVSPFPDGKRVLFSQMNHPSADLYLVENFR